MPPAVLIRIPERILSADRQQRRMRVDRAQVCQQAGIRVAGARSDEVEVCGTRRCERQGEQIPDDEEEQDECDQVATAEVRRAQQRRPNECRHQESRPRPVIEPVE